MTARSLAARMAYPAQAALDSDGGVASEVTSKYSQFSPRCLQVGIAAVESVWSRLCAMAGLQSLGGDEVGWLLVGRCRRASPFPDIAFDGWSRPCRRSLMLAARAATLAHVARLGRLRLGHWIQNACLRQ
jgi:hypothetical protein